MATPLERLLVSLVQQFSSSRLSTQDLLSVYGHGLSYDTVASPCPLSSRFLVGYLLIAHCCCIVNM